MRGLTNYGHIKWVISNEYILVEANSCFVWCWSWHGEGLLAMVPLRLVKIYIYIFWPFVADGNGDRTMDIVT